MDFITGLPRTSSGHDSIWVVVDRLTKVAHFIPVHTTYTGKRLAELYLARIMCLHGVPRKIVSDRGSQFTSKFWQKLQEEMGTRLKFSTAYHPQTDGQTERVNQILEDMLRLALLILVELGTKAYHMRNSRTTTATRPVYRWHHLKLYTAGSAAHLSSGIRQANVNCSEQKY